MYFQHHSCVTWFSVTWFFEIILIRRFISCAASCVHVFFSFFEFFDEYKVEKKKKYHNASSLRPELLLEDDDVSLSGLLFFFLEDPEVSEVAGLFSTAGLDSALFLKSSRSLSRALSILDTYNTVNHLIQLTLSVYKCI